MAHSSGPGLAERCVGAAFGTDPRGQLNRQKKKMVNLCILPLNYGNWREFGNGRVACGIAG